MSLQKMTGNNAGGFKYVLGFVLGGAALISTALASADGLATPEIKDVVKAGTRIELIKEGFTGTEGPLGLADGGFVFTETQANRITRIAADGTTSTFLENTNGANGLALSGNGDIYAVQVQEPRIGIIYPANRIKVLADDKVLAGNFPGAAFGRPNDLVLDKKGGIYFTDSGAAPRTDTTAPAPRTDVTVKPAVYYIAPGGKLRRIADDIARPNGIQLSRDEKTLYVANTYGEYVLAYDIAADGSLGARRNFARLAGFAQTETGPSSGADGLAIDAEGRLYVASSAGIQVFDNSGKALGIIELPKKPQNLAFAGTDKKTLYIVGRGAAYRIATLTSGFKGRAK